MTWICVYFEDELVMKLATPRAAEGAAVPATALAKHIAAIVWVGKLREQAERVSQDGAWRGRHRPSQIARVGVLLRIPRGALGRLTLGGPKLPPTGGRVARAGPRGLRGSRRLSFAHPLVHARATRYANNPGSAGAVLRVAAVARLARVAALK